MRVRTEAGIAARAFEIVPREPAGVVRGAAHVDDAGLGCRFECGQQRMREVDGTQEVGRPGELVAVGARRSLRGEDAGIVDEDVENGIGVAKTRRRIADRSERRDVECEDVRASARAFDRVREVGAADDVANAEDEMRAQRGEFVCGLATDAAGSAGEEDRLSG